MALLKCPDCERDVSDKAATCQNCGFPVKKTLRKAHKTRQRRKRIVIFLCVLFLIALSYSLYYKSCYKKAVSLYYQGDYFQAVRQLDYIVNYKNDSMINVIRSNGKIYVFYDVFEDFIEDSDYENALTALVNGLDACEEQGGDARSQTEIEVIASYRNKYESQIKETFSLSDTEITELLELDYEARQKKIKSITGAME